MAQNITLRDALHKLGNQHHLGILVPGLIARALKDLAAQEKLSAGARQKVEKLLRDLANLETVGKEADATLKHIKSALYRELNPDKVFVDIGEDTNI